jgi:hypothetical protein
VQLWWLGRPGEDVSGSGGEADRRRNVRWERLAEVLRDLEDLREAGERMVTARRAAAAARRPPAESDETGRSEAPGVSDAGQAEGGDPPGP